MNSRIATIFTVMAVVVGAGGAVAVAHGDRGPGGGAGNAQYSQYRPGKGCGDRNHIHTGSHGRAQRPCPHGHR
jgi:hypothetical protein